MEHPIQKTNKIEYLKLAGVLGFILIASWLLYTRPNGIDGFMAAFMGVFYLVFASFKIWNLKQFAYGFQNYDLIAKKSIAYAYAFPFIQLLFGFIYIFGLDNSATDIAVIVVSVISGVGVLKKLSSKQQVHCVCLGNVIKLPLSTVTLVEDFGMAAMAVFMLFSRL